MHRRTAPRAPRPAALLLAAAAALLAAAPAAGQAGAVAGRVLDAAGDPLPGASVTVVEGPAAGRRAVADASGRYRLAELPAGAQVLRAVRLGYEPEARTVTVPPGGEAVAEFRLGAAALALPTVEVRADRQRDRERARFETEAGVTARVIGGAEMKILPGLGEADVLRAMEVLPGVISTSDFSSAFNVRGGSADQNLILLDGFPIFNPFHLGGLFSVFNSDVVAGAELFSGGFGARYGGRVSSVLTVESDLGEGPGLSAAGGVSLIASRLALTAPIPEGAARAVGGTGGRWYLSGRRSYLDRVIAPVADFPYHLTDVQGGGELHLRGGGRLRVTAYTGEDVLDLSDFQPPGGSEQSVLRLRWNWGNDVAGVRWSQPLGRAWVAETRLGWSRYAEALSFPDFGDVRFASSIHQTLLAADLGGVMAEGLTVSAGGELGRMGYQNLGEAGGTVFFEGRNRGTPAAAYAQAVWQPGDRWLLEPGARVDGWLASDARHLHLSPRLAAKRFFGSGNEGAVKVAVGRYVQFLHSLRDEQLPISNDTWLTADAHVPPVVSDQVQLGVERYWGEPWHASLEGYYRRFRGVTEFNPAEDPNDPADDLLVGHGRSYGADLLVRRSGSRVTGWAALSLLRAQRTLPDPAAAAFDDLPQEVTFPPVWDRRADVDLVLNWTLPRSTEVGARWNFGTGLPYSRPVAQHLAFEVDVRPGGGYRPPVFGRDEASLPAFIVPGERNRYRYPAYHRLDLTVRRTYERRWGTLTPYLQVLNLYNQRNVLFYFYDFGGTPPTRSGLSMFPLIPAVGVEATF